MTERVYSQGEAHVFFGRGYEGHVEPSPKYCCRSVHESGRGVNFHQCHFKPKTYRLVRSSKGVKKYGFCSLHDPETVLKKKKERNEKWDREWALKQAMWKREEETNKARAACVEAMKKIRDGHNDPRALAREVLAMFPEGGDQ